MIQLLGTDSEMILQDYDGNLVSAMRYTKGSKEKPEWQDWGNLQHDGPLLEFAINPAGSFESFNNKIEQALEASQTLVAEHNVGIARLPHAVYPDSALASYEERLLGCQPSFNCWTMNKHTVDMDTFRFHGIDHNFRTTGGHVHVGYEYNPDNHLGLEPEYMKINFGRMLDAYLGTWSVLVDPDRERRKLYGLAGDIRDKDYGLEYRSLSNFWIFNRDTREEVWKRVHQAYAKAQRVAIHEVINPDALIDGMNQYDEEKCIQIYKEVLAA